MIARFIISPAQRTRYSARMANRRIDIGIDGGGSGCRLTISVDGDTPHTITDGPANIVTDPNGAASVVRRLVTTAMGKTGLGAGAIANARICAGLAGARLPDAAQDFAAHLPFPALIVDDSVTALEGAFQEADGTLVSLGTGSFFIRKSGEAVHHIGGWGFLLGDEGSAAWLGRRALSRSLWVVDGRLPADPLAHAAMAAAAPHPVAFARDATPGDFAQIARVVFDHATTPLGQRLIADTVATLRTGLADVGHATGTPWSLTGGLGTHLHPLLPSDLAVSHTPALGGPLDGALRLAQGMV